MGKGSKPRPFCISQATFARNHSRIYGIDDTDLYYRKWITEKPCEICGNHGTREAGWCSDPHHVKTKGSGGKDPGNLVPLCRIHHSEIHTIGRKTFAKKYNVDLPARAKELTEEYLK